MILKRLRIAPYFKWYDFWMGWFFSEDSRVLYIGYLPMLGIRIWFAEPPLTNGAAVDNWYAVAFPGEPPLAPLHNWVRVGYAVGYRNFYKDVYEAWFNHSGHSTTAADLREFARGWAKGKADKQKAKKS